MNHYIYSYIYHGGFGWEYYDGICFDTTGLLKRLWNKGYYMARITTIKVLDEITEPVKTDIVQLRLF